MRPSLAASLCWLSVASAKGTLRSSGSVVKDDLTSRSLSRAAALRELTTVVFYNEECVTAQPALTRFFGVQIDLMTVGPATCAVQDERAIGEMLEEIMADFSLEAKLVEQHAFAVVMCPVPGETKDPQSFALAPPQMLPAPGARRADPTDPLNVIVPGVVVPEPPSYVVVGELLPSTSSDAHTHHGSFGHGKLNDKPLIKTSDDDTRKLQHQVWSWQGGGAGKRCVSSDDTSPVVPFEQAVEAMRLQIASRMENALAIATMSCLAGDAAEVFVTMTPVDNIDTTYLGCQSNEN